MEKEINRDKPDSNSAHSMGEDVCSSIYEEKLYPILAGQLFGYSLSFKAEEIMQDALLELMQSGDTTLLNYLNKKLGEIERNDEKKLDSFEDYLFTGLTGLSCLKKIDFVARWKEITKQETPCLANPEDKTDAFLLRLIEFRHSVLGVSY